jgi:hypothetical protein
MAVVGEVRLGCVSLCPQTGESVDGFVAPWV